MTTLRYILLTLCLLATPAWAEETFTSGEARRHWEEGAALFSAKRYHEASEAFARCHALEPKRSVLFAWAQAERLSGDCASAVGLYEQYLASHPDERQERAAREQLEKCRATLGPPSVPASPPVTSPPPLPPPTSEVPAATASRLRGIDGWTWALLGGAAASATTGTWLYIRSAATSRSAPDAGTYQGYTEQLSAARAQRIGAYVAGGGLLLFAAAAIWRAVQPATDVALIASPTGAALAARF